MGAPHLRKSRHARPNADKAHIGAARHVRFDGAAQCLQVLAQLVELGLGGTAEWGPVEHGLDGAVAVAAEAKHVGVDVRVVCDPAPARVLATMGARRSLPAGIRSVSFGS